jgi:hypothetical protein
MRQRGNKAMREEVTGYWLTRYSRPIELGGEQLWKS